MRIIDLSRELYHRTPSYPGQPPIIHGVWKTHEEAFAESGNVHGNSVMYISMPDQGGAHLGVPRHSGMIGLWTWRVASRCLPPREGTGMRMTLWPGYVSATANAARGSAHCACGG